MGHPEIGMSHMCNKIKLHLELTLKMGQSILSRTGYINFYDYPKSVLILKNIGFSIPKNSLYLFTPIYEKKVFY